MNRGRAARCAALAVALFVAKARAEDALERPRHDDAEATHGMAEFGVGVLTLPGAQVCTARGAGCSRGDTTLALDAWPMFRRGHLAAGAGVTLGVGGATDTPRNDPPDVHRDHNRRYISLEITGRYYVSVTENLDGWVGVTTGLGVVSDTFQARSGDERAILGSRGAVLLTEGLTLGLGAGVAYPIARNWRLGGGLRVSRWFLPDTPARTPLGDEASLTGSVTTVELGLTLGYRSRLAF